MTIVFYLRLGGEVVNVGINDHHRRRVEDLRTLGHTHEHTHRRKTPHPPPLPLPPPPPPNL